MISPLAYVDSKAVIGNNVTIHPFAYIDKDVVIGDNCGYIHTPVFWRELSWEKTIGFFKVLFWAPSRRISIIKAMLPGCLSGTII